jgi:hypothetical protein
MPTSCLRLGVLFTLALVVSPASAQYYVTPVHRHPIPQAPDARCGGFYTIYPDGRCFGPNYYLRPPWPPVGAVPPNVFGQGGAGGGNGPPLLYHPYVRGPRDFFMWGEMMEEQILRERRPSLVP